jgi:hypothetical protein
MPARLVAADAIAEYHRLNRAVGEAARLTLGIDDVPALPQALRVLDAIAATGRQAARAARSVEGAMLAHSPDELADAVATCASAASRSTQAVETVLELIRQLALTTRTRAAGPVTQERILQLDASIAGTLKEQRR